MPDVIAPRAHVNWDDLYDKHGDLLTRFEEFVQSYEQENKISLSGGAVDMLLIPIVELLEAGEEIDFVQVTATFKVLIGTMNTEPSYRDRQEVRTSLSLIKAFWKNWCNIPPFCGETNSASVARTES